MVFGEYTIQIEGNLSEVKRKVLEALWGKGDSFPKDWIQSSALLKITNQKYFDRRIRELRDQQGCDIETKHIDGHHCYRLNSASLKSSNPRFYLNATDKKKLFSTAESKCQVCGVKMEAGVRGLQADHKVPLIRGGTHGTSNWQALCNECNVAKRRACQGCTDDCLVCPWAFPDKSGAPVAVRLNRANFDFVRLKSAGDPTWFEKQIELMLSGHKK